MKYFDFNKLWDYYHAIEAFAISTLVFFVVWVLAALYYWTTQDLRKH